MEYLNDRLIMLSQVAHTRGQIERAERDNAAQGYLLALLDQQEKAKEQHG